MGKVSEPQELIGRSMTCKLGLNVVVVPSNPCSTLLPPDLSCLKTSRSTAHWPVGIVNFDHLMTTSRISWFLSLTWIAKYIHEISVVTHTGLKWYRMENIFNCGPSQISLIKSSSDSETTLTKMTSSHRHPSQLQRHYALWNICRYFTR